MQPIRKATQFHAYTRGCQNSPRKTLTLTTPWTDPYGLRQQTIELRRALRSDQYDPIARISWPEPRSTRSCNVLTVDMEHALVYPFNGDEYVGNVPLGQLAGKSIFRCKNGNVYEGEYEGNRMHGVGVQTWANGDVYRGQCSGGQKDGPGVYVWADGAVYRGQWKGNKRDGVGVHKFASGAVYRGQYKADELSGHGVYMWANGAIYLGEWRGDKRQGRGAHTFASGKQAFGRYEDDQEVSSVPFDAANREHAAVLRAANEAEARWPASVLRIGSSSSSSLCAFAGAGQRRPASGRRGSGAH
jgi:hypothetical protein